MKIATDVIFLGGGRYVEVTRTIAVARLTEYQMFHEFVNCPELAIKKFDATNNYLLQSVAMGFEDRSTNKILYDRPPSTKEY